MRILIVDDDAALARVLTDNLTLDGYEVAWLPNGEHVLKDVCTFKPDLILLDVSMPGEDGFEICGRLRGQQVPVIMLTARGETKDKLRGFELGVIDYITKPFDLSELRARVRAVLHRVERRVSEVTLGDVFIDFRAMVARKGRSRVHLTYREFELLRYLAERQQKVVSRGELLREVWGFQDEPMTRSVDHAIARLRKKIEPRLNHSRFIRTVHGDGYCLTP